MERSVFLKNYYYNVLYNLSIDNIGIDDILKRKDEVCQMPGLGRGFGRRRGRSRDGEQFTVHGTNG